GRISALARTGITVGPLIHNRDARWTRGGSVLPGDPKTVFEVTPECPVDGCLARRAVSGDERGAGGDAVVLPPPQPLHVHSRRRTEVMPGPPRHKGGVI